MFFRIFTDEEKRVAKAILEGSSEATKEEISKFKYRLMKESQRKGQLDSDIALYLKLRKKLKQT